MAAEAGGRGLTDKEKKEIGQQTHKECFQKRRQEKDQTIKAAATTAAPAAATVNAATELNMLVIDIQVGKIIKVWEHPLVKKYIAKKLTLVTEMAKYKKIPSDWIHWKKCKISSFHSMQFEGLKFGQFQIPQHDPVQL